MHRQSLLILGLLLIPPSALAQTTLTDSTTLQALLAEVRELRKDLQTTIVAAERAQLLLYRLQVQEASVARASQGLENAQLRLAETQDRQNKLSATIKQYEDDLASIESPSPGRQAIDQVLPQLKAKLESLEAERQQRLTNAMEAEDRLRAEQDKLRELNDQLDRLQRTLESPDQRASSNAH